MISAVTTPQCRKVTAHAQVCLKAQLVRHTPLIWLELPYERHKQEEAHDNNQCLSNVMRRKRTLRVPTSLYGEFPLYVLNTAKQHTVIWEGGEMKEDRETGWGVFPPTVSGL